MNGKKLLQKLLAAGVSVFVALSCMAMSACAPTNEAPDGEHSGQTPEEPDDGEQGGQTPEDPDDGEQGGQTPEDPDDGEQGGQTPEEPDDGEQGGQTPEDPDDGEQGGQTPEEPEEPGHVSTPLPAENKIYVVGDSTVCDYELTQGKLDNSYLPRYGYGTQIVEYFNVTSEQVVNLALSGRSSLSFLQEDEYTELKNSISDGDYLIIGFGHNDEKSGDAARYTNPNKSYTDDSTADGPSFQYTLYQNYVKLAKDAGATPILCTPIVRYAADGDYTGSEAHITDIGDYPEAIRALGEATGTTVIDLTTLTKEVYESDNAAAAYYHSHGSFNSEEDKTPINIDNTHINKYGAQMVVYEFAAALLETDNSLATHVKDNISAPTDWTIAINPDYIKLPYEAPVLTDDGALATIDGNNWYSTYMGNVGGSNNFTVTASDNVISVQSTDEKGKFSSTDDGFGGAFMQIGINDDFTMTVTATITKVPGTDKSYNGQAGFGLMLRDDIYVNLNSSGVNMPFVAAGELLSGKGSTNGATLFSRDAAAKLNKLNGSDNSAEIAVGDVYELSIVKAGQITTVSLTKGNEPTVSYTFTDYKFDLQDKNYMYICLFATRGICVDYSNVTYTYDGVSQGA